MPVYEIVDYSAFKTKIEKYLSTIKGLNLSCFRRSMQGRDLWKWIKDVKGAHLFVNEVNGKIVCALYFIVVPELKLAKYAIGMVPDFSRKTGKYFKELLDWVCRNKWQEYNVEWGEFVSIEPIFLWCKELFGDFLEVKDVKSDTVLGTCYFFTVKIKGFALS